MAGLDGDDTSATVYLDDLNPLNPDTDDPKSQGDNHLRFVKRTLVNTFPNITGPVTATQAELNALDGITATVDELNYTDGVTSNIQTQLDGKAEITRSRKNLIINGDMRIWQRGASGALPLNQFTYMADRWVADCYGAALAWGQGGTPSAPGYPTGSLAITGAAGNTGFSVNQRIESANVARTYNKKLTVSGRIYLTGAARDIYVKLYRPVTRDVFSSLTQVDAGTSVAHPGGGVWVYFTHTFATSMPSEVGNGLQLVFSSGAHGAGLVFAITDVQLEVGEEATDFELISYGEAMRDCQRYYEHVGIGVEYRIYQALAMGGAHDVRYYKVTKRTTPTISVYSQLQYYSGGTPANFSPSSWASLTNSIIWYVSSGLTSFCGWAGGTIAADAEL